MGMYTQVRGWLNVDSIGCDNLGEIQSKLEQAKEYFESDATLKDSDNDTLERKWVCHDTIANGGGNGSVYIFFGTELKNYGNPAYEWIKFLLKYFPNAEGRIDFQYEEENYWEDINYEEEKETESNPGYYQEDNKGSMSRYLLIRDGKIIKDDYTRTWCKGYGNMYGK
jgi:hypothetical protein